RHDAAPRTRRRVPTGFGRRPEGAGFAGGLDQSRGVSEHQADGPQRSGEPAASLRDRAASFGLSHEEFDQGVERMGREPNTLEAGVFGALWSEHCGYKNSRPLLRRLPTAGPQVLQGPGENAGVVDIGHGYGLAFKMESHNHPS